MWNSAFLSGFVCHHCARVATGNKICLTNRIKAEMILLQNFSMILHSARA
jgi:hypothetical protein